MPLDIAYTEEPEFLSVAVAGKINRNPAHQLVLNLIRDQQFQELFEFLR